jgi:uncharacterized protein YndB with AHSA1/START domain
MDDDRTLRTTRTVVHSPNAVYGAFASADVLASWWGPEGFTNSFQVFEDGKTAQAVKRIAGPANEQNLDRLARALDKAASAMALTPG